MAHKRRQSALIRYTGTAGRRTVDGYEWNKANGYVLPVEDAQMVQRLLDNGDFEVVEPDQPAQEEKEGEV